MFPNQNNRPNSGLGSYYQVKKGDTLDSIAASSGLTVPQIQQANGLTVPPPNGHYLDLPTSGNAFTNSTLGSGVFEANTSQIPYGPPKPPSTIPYGPPKPPGYGQNYSPNQPYYGGNATPGTPSAPNQYAGYGWGALANQPGLTQSVAGAGDVPLANITAQLASGQLPPTLSLYAANNLVNPKTGVKFTPQEISAAGYSFNPATGAYSLGGVPNAQGGTTPPAGGMQAPGGGGNSAFMNTGFMQQYAAQGTGFYDQKRWDPVRKKFVKIGELIREGKLDERTGKTNFHKGEGNATPVYTAPAQATNAGNSPTQNLGTNQAGG